MEYPRNVSDDTRVTVTFPDARQIDLLKRGISEQMAAELRARLSTFAEYWDGPEMDVYDGYDIATQKVSF